MGAQAHRRPSIHGRPSIEKVPSDCGDVEEQQIWEDTTDAVDDESVHDEVMAVEAAVAAASSAVPASTLSTSKPSTRPALTKATLSSLNSAMNEAKASRHRILPSIEKTPLSTYIAKFSPRRGARAIKCFETADLKPLISVSSLKELEVDYFTVNPKLRHDMNFERELRYRPNKEGPEAAIKSRHEDRFWIAVEVELEWYIYFLSFEELKDASEGVRDDWLSEFRARQRRLPGMFRTMKSIVLSMTPQHEVTWVKDALDVDLIMQEIEKGQFEMTGFATWIASWMKTHCAPIRDQYVDMMVRKATFISADGAKPSSVVEVLRALFLMLENMKLDVANHQIVQLRPKMLKSFTNFERGFYLDQISRGTFEYEPMLPWYLQRKPSSQFIGISIPPYPLRTDAIPPSLKTFINKYIASLLYPVQYSCPTSSSTENRLGLDFPPSFEHDRDRLELLHQDLHSLIYTDICLLKISSLLHMNRVPDQAPQVTEIALRTFRVILWDIVQNENEISSRSSRGASSDTAKLPYPTLPIPLSRWINASIGNIAVEMVRCVVSVFTSEMCRYQRLSQPQKLPDSIIDERVAKTEAWLRQNLHPSSGLFQQRKAALRQRLVQRVTDGVNKLRTMNPLAVFQRLVLNGPHHYNALPRPGGLGSSNSASASRILTACAGLCSANANNVSLPTTASSHTSGPSPRAMSFSSSTRPRAITPGAASILEDKKRRVFDTTMRLHHAHAQGTNSNVKTAGDAVFEGVLRRIAHIAVLHWWVWSPIIYFEEDNSDAIASNTNGEDSALTPEQEQHQEDKRRASEALERKRRRVFSRENEEAVLFLDDYPESDDPSRSDQEHAIVMDENESDDDIPLRTLIEGVVGKDSAALSTVRELQVAKAAQDETAAAAAASSSVVMVEGNECHEVDEAMRMLKVRVKQVDADAQSPDTEMDVELTDTDSSITTGPDEDDEGFMNVKDSASSSSSKGTSPRSSPSPTRPRSDASLLARKGSSSSIGGRSASDAVLKNSMSASGTLSKKRKEGT